MNGHIIQTQLQKQESFKDSRRIISLHFRSLAAAPLKRKNYFERWFIDRFGAPKKTVNQGSLILQSSRWNSPKIDYLHLQHHSKNVR